MEHPNKWLLSGGLCLPFIFFLSGCNEEIVEQGGIPSPDDEYTIYAEHISTIGPNPHYVEMDLDLQFLPDHHLSTSTKQKIEIVFSIQATRIEPLDQFDDYGYVVLSRPDDFTVTIGEEYFEFDGTQEWQGLFLGGPCTPTPDHICLLNSIWRIELQPDNAADQFVFTLNGQNSLTVQLNLPYEQSAFSVTTERDSSTGVGNLEITFADDIAPRELSTQLVMVDEDDGQPILDDAHIQSKCAVVDISRSGENPMTLTFDELSELTTQTADPCDNYNAALVRLKYLVPGRPMFTYLEGDFFDVGYFTSLPEPFMPRYATKWVAIPDGAIKN